MVLEEEVVVHAPVVEAVDLEEEEEGLHDPVAVLAGLGEEEGVPPDQMAAVVPRQGLAFPVPRPRVQVVARLAVPIHGLRSPINRVASVVAISGWVIGPA